MCPQATSPGTFPVDEETGLLFAGTACGSRQAQSPPPGRPLAGSAGSACLLFAGASRQVPDPFSESTTLI